MVASSRGFTLIEILVVLFIISIVTSVALLSISHNANKKIESFANELTQMITLAEEQAMLQPTVLGLSLNDQSFHFASLESKVGKKNTWVPLQDVILKKHIIPKDIQISLNTENNHHPQIIISTNGDVTPFTIYVGKKGEKPSYVIIGTADGNIANKALF